MTQQAVQQNSMTQQIFCLEVEQIDNVFDNDYEIRINFSKDHENTPDAFYRGTGTFIDDKIVDVIKKVCPWFRHGAHIHSHCIYIYGQRHPRLNMEKMQSIKTILHKELEQAALQHWLYLGLPRLEDLIKKNLGKSIYRTHALIEYQAKYGYDRTKVFVNQFQDVFRSITFVD